MISNLGVLNILLSITQSDGTDMGDQAASFQTQHALLSSMRSTVGESLKVAILIFFLGDSTKYVSTRASVDLFRKEVKNGNFATKIFIDKYKTLSYG